MTQLLLRNDIKELALAMARGAIEKKAESLVVLDVRGVTYLADYFIICSGNTTRHAKAIADEIDYRLSAEGIFPTHVEGFPDCRWVLMDYGDIIVHVFDAETRAYYDLDGLWGDAPIVKV